MAEQAKQVAVHLLGIDRPGMGLSSYKPNRRFLDWPDDVIELVNSLHLNHFAVVGFSGGGPSAPACAYKNSQRLTACGTVAGVGRIRPFLSFLSQWLPWILLPITKRFFRNEEQAQNSLQCYFGGRSQQTWNVLSIL